MIGGLVWFEMFQLLLLAIPTIGQHQMTEQEDLFLDVYRPTVQQPLAPAVLLIHGGNFIGSSRRALLSHCHHPI